MTNQQTTLSQTAETRGIATDIFAMIGLFALVMMLYLPSTQFDFLNWDDPWYVLNNQLIKNWSFGNLSQIATQPVARNYAPITILSFLVDHTFWGDNATGYHLVNVLIHLLNGFLVYKLLVKLSGNQLVAWGSAAMFVAHPLQVETVAWVSSRKGLLSATFMLATLYCWLPRRESGSREGLGYLFFIAALLCKAIAIMLPPIVVIWHVLVNRKAFAEAVVQQFVPTVMSVLLLLYTMSAQTTIVGGIRAHIGFSKGKLLSIDAVIIWKYVGMLLWPTRQCVLYDPPTEGIGLQIALSIAGLIAVGIVSWRLRDRFPRLVSSVAIFALLLLPVMNLFPITTLMNDRYLYLPSIPFFALIAAGLLNVFSWLAKHLRLPKHGFSHCLAAVCMLFAVLGYGRSTAAYLPVWKDSLSLWTHATQETPTLAVTWIQLALTHHGMGNTEGAISALQTATRKCELDGPDHERVTEMLQQWTSEQREVEAQANAEQEPLINEEQLRANFDQLLRSKRPVRISGSLRQAR